MKKKTQPFTIKVIISCPSFKDCFNDDGVNPDECLKCIRNEENDLLTKVAVRWMPESKIKEADVVGAKT